jgi:hypothetical protein
MKMKCLLALLLLLLLISAPQVSSARAVAAADAAKPCRVHDGKSDCTQDPSWCKSREGSCSPEMRGRCGKRRGDWYGARQPVSSAAEARKLLLSYFTGQEYTVSEVSEKKWGFRADILDRDRKIIIDRVMIDKRSGRIRSLD